jgi:hypothetical protein
VHKCGEDVSVCGVVAVSPKRALLCLLRRKLKRLAAERNFDIVVDGALELEQASRRVCDLAEAWGAGSEAAAVVLRPLAAAVERRLVGRQQLQSAARPSPAERGYGTRKRRAAQGRGGG